MSAHDQRGDSLIEIIIAIVVIGVVVSAIVAAINTSENGSSAHRELVTGDTVMRRYAAAAKSAVRTSCPGGTWSPSYSPPSGYTVNSLAGQSCPAATSTATVTLQVGSPNGTSKSMQIVVRSP